MKILTVVGARPQFIKCAPVSVALRARHEEFLVHTGQHYDATMSRVFFDEMGIPRPDVNLGAGSGSHATQTAAMMTGIERLVLDQQPDAVMVYGDTNSTMAGAVAAAKVPVPIVHVEAGLRSFNRAMPEEINRVVTDCVADVLCCPTEGAVKNLRCEGITRGVVNTGDVMYDAVLRFKPMTARSEVLMRLGLKTASYILLTMHRAGNTDDFANLSRILAGVARSGQSCVFPVHPRTRAAMTDHGVDERKFPSVVFVEPMGYFDFMALTMNACMIVTDSGGVQKEAYWHGIPCITVRNETEWVETVDAGWNVLVGANQDKICAALQSFKPTGPRPAFYGDGHAADKIVSAIEGIKSRV